MCSLLGVVLIARPAALFGERAAEADGALPVLELIDIAGLNITASLRAPNSTLPGSVDAGMGNGGAGPDVTPSERLLAVGCVNLDLASGAVECLLRCLGCSVALVGVLGATGACEFLVISFCSSLGLLMLLSDTSTRAIGSRTHPLHNLVAFSTLSVALASIAYVPPIVAH